jgi:putative GTP pyrophosphokinase
LLSNTQVDKLGERLKQGAATDADLDLLDEYRSTFIQAYQRVVETILRELHLEPTGRSAKTTDSIVQKLRRGSMKLSRMQDIAGCRITVSDRAQQDRVVNSLSTLFTGSTVVDRRANPSHGYRAVHVIARVEDARIEIQVRTEMQHFWAQLSERLSDIIDPSIKYGGGDSNIQEALSEVSSAISGFEAIEDDFPEEIRKQLIDTLQIALKWQPSLS